MAVTYVNLYLAGQAIQVVEGSQLHLIYASMGATASPPMPGEAVRADPFPQYVDADELAAALAALPTGGGGSGAVSSVNGQTGAVDLGAADVGAAQASHSHGLADLTAAGTRDDTTFLRGDGAFAVPPGSTPSIANTFAGDVVYVVQNGDGTWPNRRTSRTDVLVQWIRIVAASADPAAATSPAVNGAYTNDIVMGV